MRMPFSTAEFSAMPLSTPSRRSTAPSASTALSHAARAQTHTTTDIPWDNVIVDSCSRCMIAVVEPCNVDLRHATSIRTGRRARRAGGLGRFRIAPTA
jgi:hypothetical protein